MNERIRELRKALNLNQTDFGEKIGVKQATVAGYENGTRQPIDAVITAICREFNVNETWLRTGKGDMFIPRSNEDLLMDFAKGLTRISDDDFKKKIVTALAKMDEEQWNAFKRIMDVFMSEFADNSEKKSDGLDIDKEVEEYRQELILQKEKESKASDTIEEGA